MTIDLGEIAEVERTRPRRPARPLRPAGPALAVLLLLAAALLGPSGPAQRLAGTEVVQPAGYDSAVVVGEVLLAVTTEAGGGGVASSIPELAAFRLPELTRLWQMALPAGTAIPGIVGDAVQVGDVLLVTMLVADPEMQSCTTWALAIEDGRTLWCDAGSYAITGEGGLLRYTFDGEQSIIAAPDPRTGAPRWSQPAPGQGLHLVPAVDGRIATYLVFSDDRLEMRDAQTGGLLRARAGFSPAVERSSFVQGELFVLVDSGGVHAYGLADLEHRWSLPPGTATLPAFHMQLVGCDGRPCYLVTDRGVLALDARTGEELWFDERWRNIRFAGDRLLLGEDSYWDAGRSGARTVLADADGTPIDGLEAWSLLDPGLRPGEEVIAVRPIDGNRILVADLGSAGTEPQPLGVLHGSISDCQSIIGGVSCRRLDGGRSLLVLPR
ncbi:PQQ-binding-like beta-propeller repeat protein [Micromonosporaceae bacterium DT55]|uniref:outer membrane protein assembly factor BamB family protein n=1 Tax=Melissospora conviva TaxID=3388432 RepID=UPI003C181A07